MKGKKVLMLPEVYNQVSAGGPFAVVRKIFETDTQKIFSYIFIESSLALLHISEGSFKKTCIGYLKFFLAKISSLPIFFHICFKLIVTYKKISSYNISSYSSVISHNIFYSYIIARFYKNITLINIYHGQGSMYTEYCDLGGYKRNIFIKLLLDHLERYVSQKSYKLGFPSYGAYETLISTHKELEKIISGKKKNFSILYNSIDFSIPLTHNPDIEKNIKPRSYNFVTVSSIVYAKGVDRIPLFLSKLKEKNIDFTWTIIGRKNSYSQKLKENIQKYDIESQTYLHELPVSKSDIYGLFSRTDFYIMFHRYSIFDLATLEAMYLGNIPVLSRIGGNKEVILQENGILVDEEHADRIDVLIDFLQKNSQEELKEKNKKIVREYFSDTVFIQRYYDLLENENLFL